MPPWPDATPYKKPSQQTVIVARFFSFFASFFVSDSTYLWAQRIVIVDARFLICVDAGTLELEESLDRNVHKGKGGNRDTVGACDVGGSRAEPRCNCGIDPVRLSYR